MGELDEPDDPEERDESLFQFSSVVSPQQKNTYCNFFVDVCELRNVGQIRCHEG